MLLDFIWHDAGIRLRFRQNTSSRHVFLWLVSICCVQRGGKYLQGSLCYIVSLISTKTCFYDRWLFSTHVHWWVGSCLHLWCRLSTYMAWYYQVLVIVKKCRKRLMSFVRLFCANSRPILLKFTRYTSHKQVNKNYMCNRLTRWTS